jgi:hypothetical protein
VATIEAPPEALVELERPLGSYTALIASFSAIFGGAIAVAGATGRLPRRPPLLDIALAGVAGHKVSRLIAKDKVASPLRAPFIETVTDEDGDLVDEPTGAGMRRAVGQLLTCPKCVGQWACATFLIGTIYSPRPTRAVASVFAADAISDFLHAAFRAADNAA